MFHSVRIRLFDSSFAIHAIAVTRVEAVGVTIMTSANFPKTTSLLIND